MSKNVVYLHSQPNPIGHFLRIGTSGHRQLETLLSSGKMMVDRVVVEASAATRQRDLISAIGEAGGEVADEGLAKSLQKISEHLEKKHAVLEALHAAMPDAPHSRAPSRRQGLPLGATMRKR